MIKVAGFAGSLRRGSFNKALLKAAARVMPDGAELDVHAIDDIPLYDADVERERGVPPAAAELKRAIEDAAGLVIATPEYNGGIPGVAKNVIDWISRPSEDIPKVLHGKPVALIGATPGRFGTTFSQLAWLHVLRTLRMRLWVEAGPFYVPGAGNSIDADGNVDAELEQRLASYMSAFVQHLRGPAG
jgi:NAD(P)H-dependent FMN reductase